MGHLDRINTRRVANGEVQVLAVKPNAQLIVQKGLAEWLVGYLGLLSENNGRNGWGELRWGLHPGEFFLGQQQSAPEELLFRALKGTFLAFPFEAFKGFAIGLLFRFR